MPGKRSTVNMNLCLIFISVIQHVWPMYRGPLRCNSKTLADTLNLRHLQMLRKILKCSLMSTLRHRFLTSSAHKKLERSIFEVAPPRKSL